MAPQKATGGKSKSGAPAGQGAGAAVGGAAGGTSGPRTIQTRSQRAGLQVRTESCPFLYPLIPPFPPTQLVSFSITIFSNWRTANRFQPKIVSRWSYPPLPQTTHTAQRPDRCKSRSLHICDIGVPHCRST